VKKLWHPFAFANEQSAKLLVIIKGVSGYTQPFIKVFAV